MENKEPKKHPISDLIQKSEYVPVDINRLTDKIMSRVEQGKSSSKTSNPFGVFTILRWSFSFASLILIVAFFQEYTVGYENTSQRIRPGEKAVILNSSSYMPEFEAGDDTGYAEFFQQKIKAKEDRKQFWSKLREKYETDK